jgi:hypothetical protein
MTISPTRTKLENAIDRLAEVEHERWAHWQRYVHSKGERQADGSIVLPPDLVRRWERQIETPYADLSEDEKKSDCDQVRRYISTVTAIIDG